MKQYLWKLYGNPHLWCHIFPVKCYISINAHAIKTNKQNASVHMAVLQYFVFKTNLFEQNKIKLNCKHQYMIFEIPQICRNYITNAA